MAVINPPSAEEAMMKGYDPAVARRLAGFARPYAGKLLLALLLMLTGSAMTVIGPYLVKLALDAGLEAGSLPVLRQAVLLYVAATAVQALTIFFRVRIMARVGQSIIFDLRARLFEHIQKLSLSFFSRYSVGRLITRVINDVGVLREFIVWAILAIARDLFTLVGILVAMLALNVRLSLLTFAVLPVMLGVTILFKRQARENYRAVRSAISWVNSVLAENINGVRVVQAFSRQEHNYIHYRDEVNRNNLDTNLRAARIAALYPSVIEFLGTLATALVVWLGGAAVLGEQITPGILVAFVLYVERFFEPIRDLSRRYDSFQSTMAGGERIFSLLDTPVEVQDAPGAPDLPAIRGEVTFEHVSFHYSDDPALVLSDIHLHVQAGQTVALVGETGAGKSTFVKLVSRFHDPSQGRILIDGQDLCRVTQSSLRRQMGIVLQDPFLFNGTVAENIHFGRLEASDAEVEAAARAVGAHDFIVRLRNGYATSVEEGGLLLSVGQRQLISFARALLADPRILILDEATSSVDTQTERIIQQALARLLKGRTSFVIAHRLSTVVNADRILVIQGGQVVEQGTHAELLAQGGVYYELYKTGF
ncbi:MAG TPA: ABC transporter ATP-binding protein, partial [Anaerolineales bacterium]|nr:ABC transporter ATP-binding protein [Anaerolineales bacterium]